MYPQAGSENGEMLTVAALTQGPKETTNGGFLSDDSSDIAFDDFTDDESFTGYGAAVLPAVCCHSMGKDWQQCMA